jgi:hypothetical protein
MTTLDATALARVLAEHRLDTSASTIDHTLLTCKCGARFPYVHTFERHLPEVLASLVAASETQARAEELEAASLAMNHEQGHLPRTYLAERADRLRAAALSSTDQQGGK